LVGGEIMTNKDNEIFLSWIRRGIESPDSIESAGDGGFLVPVRFTNYISFHGWKNDIISKRISWLVRRGRNIEALALDRISVAGV
jgi:hypothetical protein